MTMESELDFYFNKFNCISAIDYAQLVSVNGNIAMTPYMGDCTFNDSISDKTLSNAKKYNKIQNKLSLLTPDTRRQLASLFDLQYRYPPELRSALGKKAGLALWYQMDNKKSDEENLQELLKKCKNKANVQSINMWIEKEYEILKNIWSLIQ